MCTCVPLSGDVVNSELCRLQTRRGNLRECAPFASTRALVMPAQRTPDFAALPQRLG
jgi:hypothetical protein